MPSPTADRPDRGRVGLVTGASSGIGRATALAWARRGATVVASVVVLATLAASMVLLSLAARSLPIGTAYAVWVGIGAFGAAAGGIVLFGEPVTAPRLGFLALLIVAIVGLRLTAPD